MKMFISCDYVYIALFIFPTSSVRLFQIKKRILQEKAVEAAEQKAREKNLNPRNRKACHSVSTALLQSVAEIVTQSTMKSSTKTLHEFTSHIPPKYRKGTRTKVFNERNVANGQNCQSARSES
jgi:hypothetical protein